MALTLRLIEGFETQGFQRASATGGSQQPTINTTNVRAGAQGDACMSAVDANTGYADYLPYEYEGSANSNAKGIGFWLRYGGAGTITALQVFAGGTGGTKKFDLRVGGASLGRVYVYDTSGTLISSISSPQIFTDTSWHLVEFWFQDGSNSASWELFVDGTSYQSGTGAAFVASNSDAFRIGQINSVGTPAAKVDDIYYAEATATTDLVSQQGYNGLDIFATTGGTGATHSGVGTLSAGTMQNIQEIPPSDTNTAAFNYDAGSATERLAPDSIATQTNLTGAVTDIDEDPDSPDANWLTASGSSTLRVTFPTPTGTPRTGAGLQNFRVLLRKNATGPSGSGTEDMLPTGLGGLDANLDGTAATIDDDPQSPGGDWRNAASNNSNTVCHATFNTPATAPSGTQTFEIYARLTPNGSACSYSVDLYESGVLVTNVGSGTLSSTTGQLITHTWSAASLGTADGSAVECVFTVTKSGGSPANRTSGEVDAVRWVAAYSATETQPGYEVRLYENGSVVSAVAAATGTLTDAGGNTVVQLSWDAAELATADGSLVECYINQTSGADRYIEVGAVEWNADYVTGDPLEYRWIRANGSDGLPGPAGLGLSASGSILADCVYFRAQWVASGSGTDSSLIRGNSTDSNQLYYGYTLSASYADWFKITSDTRTPIYTEYSQAGFGRPANNDTGIRCAEAVMMLAYAPPGATTTPQQCLVTAVGTAAVTTTKLKTVLAAMTGTAAPAYGRVVDYLRQYPHSAVGSVAYNRLLSHYELMTHGATGSAATLKMPTKNFAQSATGTASLSRSKFFTALLEITAVGSTALTRVTTYLRTLASTSTGTNALLKATSKTLSASATGTVAALRNIGKVLSHSATGAATMLRNKLFTVLLASAVNGTVALARVQTYLRTLASTATGSVGLLRSLSIRLTRSVFGAVSLTPTMIGVIKQQALITISGSVALTRNLAKQISHSATGGTVLLRGTTKAFASAATGVVDLTATLSAVVVQACYSTATAGVTLGRSVYKVLASSATSSVTLARMVGLRLTVAGNATVVAINGMVSSLLSAFSAVGSVFQQERFVGLEHQALITVAAGVTATKKIMKQFNVYIRGRFDRIFPPPGGGPNKAGLVKVPRRSVIRSTLRSLFRDL